MGLLKGLGGAPKEPLRSDLRSTHTFAELAISKAAYDEIASKLREAEYNHVFMEGGVIDMHGIGLVVEENSPVDLLAHLALLEVEPGDTLVLRSPDHMTLDAIHRLSKLVKERFADRPEYAGVEVMVLDGGLDLGVLRNAGAQRERKRADALAVDCPTCRARAGMRCRLAGEREYKNPCKERYAAAQAQADRA